MSTEHDGCNENSHEFYPYADKKQKNNDYRIMEPRVNRLTAPMKTRTRFILMLTRNKHITTINYGTKRTVRDDCNEIPHEFYPHAEKKQ